MADSAPVASGTTPSRTLQSNVSFTTPCSAAPKSSERLHTSGSSSKRLHAAFKSPLRQPDKSPSTEENSRTLQQEVSALELKESELNKQIEDLVSQGYKEEELNSYMEALHAYNEMKDIGQMLLGQLAIQLGITTRDLYTQYELQLND